jgi:hypothetical protein
MINTYDSHNTKQMSMEFSRMGKRVKRASQQVDNRDGVYNGFMYIRGIMVHWDGDIKTGLLHALDFLKFVVYEVYICMAWRPGREPE